MCSRFGTDAQEERERVCISGEGIPSKDNVFKQTGILISKWHAANLATSSHSYLSMLRQIVISSNTKFSILCRLGLQVAC